MLLGSANLPSAFIVNFKRALFYWVRKDCSRINYFHQKRRVHKFAIDDLWTKYETYSTWDRSNVSIVNFGQISQINSAQIISTFSSSAFSTSAKWVNLTFYYEGINYKKRVLSFTMPWNWMKPNKIILGAKHNGKFILLS